MSPFLLLAGFYDLAFAIWTVCWPDLWFRWAGMDAPTYPHLWMGMGLLAGIFGLGYLIAATNPLHHWPLVLLGFLAKLAGPVGFFWGLSEGLFDARAGWIVIANHVVWLPPFVLILWTAMQTYAGRPPERETPYTVEEAAAAYKLSSGETLLEASHEKPLALVFLRHFGCTFTRQILRHLQELEADARERDARLVLVHMLERGEGGKYIHSDGAVARIADPRCELYRAFGLGKGGFWELFGPRVWLKGATAFFSGCGIGHLAGDGLQMPGAFLFHEGRIISAQPARTAADLPDVGKLFEVPA
ncbi:MAG: hypothetical protein HKN82_14750 [Akkermansiaceae bacterium]|nr:hypothetical protein [Akkermansiaceae bacterium]NNM30515.1 hypothetical protein [Akkermansiaceae bacterium]